jgi:glycosyltransferase involved in cell wall biosynthesis
LTENRRVLIAAENTSARFGGEAALPFHYFRVMRQRGIPVWLVTHSRTRDELSQLYPDDGHICYVEDTALHRFLWHAGKVLPGQVADFTTAFVSRVYTQLSQKRIVRRLVREHGITVIHQPMPVSPKEPSMLHGFGVPVFIGPMNGGMNFPPAFRAKRGRAESILLTLGRASATMLNALMPGKRRASALLVANQRTRDALPGGVCKNVIELVENGVDLTLWQAPAAAASDHEKDAPATFVFMGRLVDWKAVDLLLRAFAQARAKAPMRLWVLGDGAERAKLDALAAELGIASVDPQAVGFVHFAGWLPQKACADRLRQGDCLVLPSLLECGGAVVLEAMSMGKPVIATAWGGPLDYLDPSCGILVSPDSVASMIDQFAGAMVTMAQSPSARQRLGASGLAKVHREYDWELKVDRILEIYAEGMRTHDAGAG